MAILTVGIDLAKNVFAVHGVGESGKPELKRPSVPRASCDKHCARETTQVPMHQAPVGLQRLELK
jgi:hypothetical protein